MYVKYVVSIRLQILGKYNYELKHFTDNGNVIILVL